MQNNYKYKLNWTISIPQHDKQTHQTYYKQINLQYKQEAILQNIAYIIVSNHNQPIYDKKAKGNYWTTKQVITTYNTYPNKEKQRVIDTYIEEAYTNYTYYIETKRQEQELEQAKKLQEHNKKNIIIPKLKNITEQQLENIIQQLQQLEQQYYLDIDIDYTNKYSILKAYQQLAYYKHYNIQLQPKDNTILVGNTELLEKGAL